MTVSLLPRPLSALASAQALPPRPGLTPPQVAGGRGGHGNSGPHLSGLGFSGLGISGLGPLTFSGSILQPGSTEHEGHHLLSSLLELSLERSNAGTTELRALLAEMLRELGISLREVTLGAMPSRPRAESFIANGELYSLTALARAPVNGATAFLERPSLLQPLQELLERFGLVFDGHRSRSGERSEPLPGPSFGTGCRSGNELPLPPREAAASWQQRSERTAGRRAYGELRRLPYELLERRRKPASRKSATRTSATRTSGTRASSGARGGAGALIARALRSFGELFTRLGAIAEV